MTNDQYNGQYAVINGVDEMPTRDHHTLWEVSNGDITTTCVMVSCCGGAELQVLRTTGGDEEIVLRELYPDRDSLYERARALRDHEGTSRSV